MQERVVEAPELAGYVVRVRNDHEIEVEVTKGQGLNQLFAELSAKSLQVASIRTKTNRLEELFRRLVENKRETAA
jgi:ABC-2 type transport system ATP-binding protein